MCVGSLKQIVRLSRALALDLRLSGLRRETSHTRGYWAEWPGEQAFILETRRLGPTPFLLPLGLKKSHGHNLGERNY